jgi:hypothetical protein
MCVQQTRVFGAGPKMADQAQIPVSFGQFYSALGVDFVERYLSDTATPINQVAELRTKWMLEERKR